MNQLIYRLPPWMRKHQLAALPNTGNPEVDEYEHYNLPTELIDKADLVLSVDSETKLHRPVLDIDFPVHVEPSSTEGHFHLYLDKPLRWDQYKRLLTALSIAGIIEPGYERVSVAREYTAVRLPWVKKRSTP